MAGVEAETAADPNGPPGFLRTGPEHRAPSRAPGLASAPEIAWRRHFHPLIAAWFAEKFGAPTEPQLAGWPRIAAGESVLLAAPTGSGKTLAAFLLAIDRMFRLAVSGRLREVTRIVYVSPLKALANDVRKNLEEPLAEIRARAFAAGLLMPEIRAAVRTGDTPASERNAMLRRPPHILVTTPESLYLLLTARRGRSLLATADTVIVDEIHALVGNKRGAHLALSLERLEALGGEASPPPAAPAPTLVPTHPALQRIGLSATARPLEEIASFLAGAATERGPARVLSIPRRRRMDLAVEVPRRSELGPVATNEQWAERYDRLAELAAAHRTVLVFVGTRALAERVAHHLRARVGEDLVAAHHGSLSRKIRLRAEERFKRGELKVMVATASLELGLDIGAVDLVCQIGSPRVMAVAWQRVGRAGHWRGATPKGRFFALTRDDLLECAALIGAIHRAIKGARDGALEGTIEGAIKGAIAGAVEGAPEGTPDGATNEPPTGARSRAAGASDQAEKDVNAAAHAAAPAAAHADAALDPLVIPPWPRDILAQQMVATVASAAPGADWSEDGLFALCRGAHPYRDLPRSEFDAVRRVLTEGISDRRGRRTALLHRYLVPAADGTSAPKLRARKGARLAALTGGGAIAENASYAVVAEPEGVPVGSLDEDFAIESHAGDIILLGTTSWRVRGVETGRVRVEDAGGAPPTIPFWKGEAPGRTREFSALVADFRRELAARAHQPADAGRAAWLAEHGLDEAAGALALAYAAGGAAELGGSPMPDEIVAERFFDEGGGMQLVIHAPFGSRINQAWGMALRKRFCRGFDFELQAAASENGLVLALSEQHSFPLETIFEFLSPKTVQEVLEQAVLQSPLFPTRWRWIAARALALPRFRGGRKLPPQIARMRAEDLLAAAFPMALGCQDNHGGEDLEIPDHPYVHEAMRDCLQERLDLQGLKAVLTGMEAGTIRCRAVDRPAPSLFAAEILNSAPYSYLDDAPLEERRARAVSLRRPEGLAEAAAAGALDPAAIAAIVAEARPAPGDADEWHDLLLSLRWLPGREAGAAPTNPSPNPSPNSTPDPTPNSPRNSSLDSSQSLQPGIAPELFVPTEGEWADIAALARAGRLLAARVGERDGWAPVEYGRAPAWIEGPEGRATLNLAGDPESAESEVTAILRGWMEILGPVTEDEVAARLGLSAEAVAGAMLRLEGEGQVLRGRFRAEPRAKAAGLEWCDRHLLARIHRRTVAGLRAEIEAVSPAVWERFLARWQHAEPETRLHGATGLALALDQLQGFEAPASAWESAILPARVADYAPEMLDRLCLSGEFGWARLSQPAASSAAPAAAPARNAGADTGEPAGGDAGASSRRRVRPTRRSPVAFFRRADLEWLAAAPGEDARRFARPIPLSRAARRVRECLAARGALFFNDLCRLLPAASALPASATSPAPAAVGGASLANAEAQARADRLLPSQVEDALWELAAAGLVTADGFENLRALLDRDRRRRAKNRAAQKHRPAPGSLSAAGRWDLAARAPNFSSPPAPTLDAAAAELARRDWAERHARQLLKRYGVVFRALMDRESAPAPWPDVLRALRRLEMRGEIRGGHFIGGVVGEQYALPEAVAALRAARKLGAAAPLPDQRPAPPPGPDDPARGLGRAGASPQTAGPIAGDLAAAGFAGLAAANPPPAAPSAARDAAPGPTTTPPAPRW